MNRMFIVYTTCLPKCHDAYAMPDIIGEYEMSQLIHPDQLSIGITQYSATNSTRFLKQIDLGGIAI